MLYSFDCQNCQVFLNRSGVHQSWGQLFEIGGVCFLVRGGKLDASRMTGEIPKRGGGDEE
jgi:hypothetical protein